MPEAAGGGSRLPALDGLRAAAVMAVMLFHIEMPHLVQGGYIGVDVFFVLSGYLITSLVLTELDRVGSVNLVAFYVRRALRLGPALVVVAASCVVLVALPGMRYYRQDTLRALPYVATYLGNWVNAIAGGNALGLLSHTWSLAVEEQYYLLWPGLLLASLRFWSRASIYRVLLGLAGVVWISRVGLVVCGVGWAQVYFSTCGHGDGLLVGSALGLAGSRPGLLGAASGRARRLLAPAACLVLLALALVGDNTLSVEWTIFVPLAVTAAAALICALVTGDDSAASRLLSSRWAVWVGQRSYGLYLWHIPIYLSLTLELGWPSWEVGAFGIPLAFLVESVCYRRVELPALRLKSRFAPKLPAAA